MNISFRPTNGLAALVMAWVCAISIHAQQPTAAGLDRDDHRLILEFGAAADWDPREASVHGGGTFAFEVTPIENWLELEAGVTVLAADGGLEIPFDLLFKKPWRFSPQFEFMIGAGPTVSRATGREAGTFWGLEAVLDFMFWPRKNVGWYLEPGYELTWREGRTHRGLGVAAGLLLGR